MMNNEKKVILLIDDERPVRESYKNYLEDYDFDILEASSGERGIKTVFENHVDLVLLDLRMPGTDGFSVLEALKEKIKSVPVVVVSGTGIVNDTVRALHLGAWDFILKPIENMDVLMHTISSSLEKAELIRKNKEYQEHLEEKNEKLSKTIDGLVKSQRKEIQSEKMKIMTNILKELADEITEPISVGLIASSHLQSKTEEMQNNIAKEPDVEYLSHYLEKQKTLNDMIWNNIKKSADVLTKFKNVVEFESVESESTFKISDTIKDVCSIFRKQISLHNIDISIDCDDDLEIISQHNVFYQIFYNLIQNTLFHAFNEKSSGEILFKIKEENEKLNIVYSDNGAGIPKEIQKNIFDPFFTTKKSSNILGFGLTIVYNLVTLGLKGTIEFETEVNNGLSFFITIPMVDIAS